MGIEQLIVSSDGYITTMTINREDKHNALTPSLLRSIEEQIKTLKNSKNTRVIVITGAGRKAFSAGYDITEIPASSGQEVATEGTKILETAFNQIRDCTIPIIAMINGYTIGAGLDLAINCDFRICHSTSKFGITPAKLGIVYHYAGLKRFTDLIGISATKYLFYTGKLISPEMALKYGLIDFIVEENELEEFSYSFAKEIAYNSAPLAVSGMKYIINALYNKIDLTSDEIDKSIQLMISAFDSKDMIEGQKAFIQKRAPKFTGE